MTGLLDLKTLILVHAALSALFYFRYRQFPRFKSIRYWAIVGGLLALASGTNLLRFFVSSTAILIAVVSSRLQNVLAQQVQKLFEANPEANLINDALPNN